MLERVWGPGGGQAIWGCPAPPWTAWCLPPAQPTPLVLHVLCRGRQSKHKHRENLGNGTARGPEGLTSALLSRHLAQLPLAGPASGPEGVGGSVVPGEAVWPVTFEVSSVGVGPGLERRARGVAVLPLDEVRLAEPVPRGTVQAVHGGLLMAGRPLLPVAVAWGFHERTRGAATLSEPLSPVGRL